MYMYINKKLYTYLAITNVQLLRPIVQVVQFNNNNIVYILQQPQQQQFLHFFHGAQKLRKNNL